MLNAKLHRLSDRLNLALQEALIIAALTIVSLVWVVGSVPFYVGSYIVKLVRNLSIYQVK